MMGSGSFLERLLSDSDTLEDGLSVISTRFEVLFVNQKMRDWYAYRLVRPGEKCYRLFHGRTRPCTRCPVRVAILRNSVASGLVPYHGPEGEIRGWQKLVVFPVLEDEEVTKVVEYVEDVTGFEVQGELKRLQRDVTLLEREVELLQALLKERESAEQKRQKDVEALWYGSLKPLFVLLGESLLSPLGRECFEVAMLCLERLLVGKTPSFFPSLTPREWEVARLVAQGKTSKEIAEEPFSLQKDSRFPSGQDSPKAFLAGNIL